MDTKNQNVHPNVQNIPGILILNIGNQHFDYSMHVFSKHLPREGGRSICLFVWGFSDGLLIFRIFEEVQAKHERFGSNK